MQINKRLGFYRVGTQEYQHKIPALLKGTETNTHPEWVFHREFFDQVKWKQEPTESLWELYRQRAQQLRDTYDYLILGYSGGSDSRNILDVFLQNNIKLDEIVSRYSYKGMGNNYEATTTEWHYSNNVTAEWEFRAKIDFQWISQQYPDIKLTLYDWWEHRDLSLSEDFWDNRNVMLNPFIEQRRSLQHIDSVHTKSRVGYIMGVDKPRIVIKDGKYYIYFLDVVGYSMTPDQAQVGNAETEWFYWAPEAEPILRKQAHMLKRYFQARPELHSLISWPPTPGIPIDYYQSVVREQVYPTWNPNWFQLRKSTDTTVSSDKGILNSDDDLKNQHSQGLELIKSLVDSQYFNTASNNFHGMITPFYEI